MEQIAPNPNAEEHVQTIALPNFPGLPIERIHFITTTEHALFAQQHLLNADVLGFDTESKPTFIRGQRSDGPHLIQFSTDTQAFLFPVVLPEQCLISQDVIQRILESDVILKVGFGLRDDHQRLKKKLSIVTAHVVDLSRTLADSKQKQAGAKSSVAKFFGQNLHKSKRISTSNWANLHLSERQLKYAADDAYSALMLYRAWQCKTAV